MSSSLELSEILIDNGDKLVKTVATFQENEESSGPAFYVTRARFRTLRGSLCNRRIIDPNGPFQRSLNKIFLISCVLALAWDPLFFYVPVVDGDKKCLFLDKNLAIIACVLRTFIDLFYLIHIILQFRTGFVATSSRVLGRGEIVKDLGAIARRYISSYFIVDILAVLPIPQIAVYVIIQNWNGTHLTSEGLLMLVIITQYVPRFVRIYPLLTGIKRTSGLATYTIWSIWASAAYNLFLYMLASHVVGSIWYLFAIDRQSGCWGKSCLGQGCHQLSLYCKDRHGVNYAFNSSYCTLVDPSQITDSYVFNSGLFYDALRSEIVQSTRFLTKLSYCFWWGLRNLSSCGQNLDTSPIFGENVFTTLICIGGLILFALLIGNMQKYLQMLLSADRTEEEVRLRRQVMEQWMSRRMLPEGLRERIRRYEEYNWKETRGVNEESMMLDLPRDIRMDVKRHIGLALVMGVPFFTGMDEQLKDTICDRLKPVLYTKDCYIVRQDDPVCEMLFIVTGKLSQITTNDVGTDFFSPVSLKARDFCGEELLTWALDPRVSNLPISARTVRSETEVEAFALLPDDLKSVASQVRMLLSDKQLRSTFRYYSSQWRTWAAYFIQAAWRRYCRKCKQSWLEAAAYNLANEGIHGPSLDAAL